MPVELPPALHSALIEAGWSPNDTPPEKGSDWQPGEPEPDLKDIPLEEMTSRQKILAGLKRLSAEKAKRGG